MFCKKCGSEINDDAVVCINCGCAVKDDFNAEQQPVKKKINVLCLLGFIFSLISLIFYHFGLVPVAGLVLSIIGLVQAVRRKEKLKGLGIAGIAISGITLIYAIYNLVALLILFSIL